VRKASKLSLVMGLKDKDHGGETSVNRSMPNEKEKELLG
jgi:hypothetical protein